MGRGTATSRVSVPVRETIRKDLTARPSLVGLAEDASEARILEATLELGYREAQRRARESARRSVYEDYERDPERAAAAREHQRIALEGGVI